MAKQFLLSKANPIPFTELVNWNYPALPPKYERTPKTVNGCYFQKWQIDHETTVQFCSDWVATIKVYKSDGDYVTDIVPVVKANNIVGQTFKVYEAQFDFSDYGLGLFYAEITYTDDSAVVHTFQSEIWHTANKWDGLLLWEYSNSYNVPQWPLVAETGVVFNFLVEGKIRGYNPDFDDALFIDQVHNPSLLSATPFDRYRLETDFLPDWALRILNFAMNVDEKKINGELYEKAGDDAKWDITEVDAYEYKRVVMPLIPIQDFFLNSLIVGDMPDGEFVIYPKRLQWIDNAVDRTITGKFRINTLLKRIDIVNKAAATFTVKVGTTNGGSELGQKTVSSSEPTATLLLYKLFDSDTTIYITGVAGNQINLFVMYDQDDEVGINITGGGDSGLLPVNMLGSWLELNDGELEATWDLASGLGKPGTKYSNCAICDGRNGTPNLMDSYVVYVGISNIALLGSSVGANSKIIPKAALPAEGLPMFADQANGNPADKPGVNDNVAITSNYGSLGYEIHRASNAAAIGKTGPLGSGDQFNVQPKSIYALPFIAIS